MGCPDLRQPDVACMRNAAVAGHRHQLRSPERRDDVGGVARYAIFDDDDVVRVDALVERRTNRATYEMSRSICRNDDTDIHPHPLSDRDQPRGSAEPSPMRFRAPGGSSMSSPTQRRR